MLRVSDEPAFVGGVIGALWPAGGGATPLGRLPVGILRWAVLGVGYGGAGEPIAELVLAGGEPPGPEPVMDSPHSSPLHAGAGGEPFGPFPEIDSPQSSPLHAGVGVAAGGAGGPGVPSCASQPHGSVMVTAVGTGPQTVHCLVVTVKPCGM